MRGANRFAPFFLLEHGLLERVNPTFKRISEDPTLEKNYTSAFNKRAFLPLLQLLKGDELIDEEKKQLKFQGWYMPGDHSLPHTDAVPGSAGAKRQVAFVWHLAKDWRSERGGALFWCPKSLYLPPLFNTLVLFNVGPDTHHFVTEVSPYAQGKRLAVKGWWTGQSPTGDPLRVKPERLEGGPASIEIY